MNEVLTPPLLHTRRKKIAALVAACAINISTASCAVSVESPVQNEAPSLNFEKDTVHVTTEQVIRSLGSLAITGRGPKTGYSREEFGSGWTEEQGCDTRNLILKRDLNKITFNSVTCDVISGILFDPYSGATIPFTRGKTTSDDVQIDHVVSLSNAWQMSNPDFRQETDEAYGIRVNFANDPVNLRAVDGKINNAKGDADAASWLPPNKSFRCEFVSQQVIVKNKYDLRVTQAEHDTILQILETCPNQAFAIPN